MTKARVKITAAPKKGGKSGTVIAKEKVKVEKKDNPGKMRIYGGTVQIHSRLYTTSDGKPRRH